MLRRVAAIARWGDAQPKDTGLGIATTFGQERDMPTWVACAARVNVDRSNGFVTVEKLILVVDAGTIVHPDGALAQVQGAALWGLSMALHEGSAFVKGQPKDTNLDTYTPLRMGDVPEMEVEFVPSTQVPVGLGEPATTVVGPAIRQSATRSSPHRAPASVICQSARTPCTKHSTRGPEAASWPEVTAKSSRRGLENTPCSCLRRAGP